MYVNGYNHYLRAMEFRESILKGVASNNLLIIANTRDSRTLECLKHSNIDISPYALSLSKKDCFIMFFYLLQYLFLNRFRGLLCALLVYKAGVRRYFQGSHLQAKGASLISFNDQPIDISILSIVLKERGDIKKSIVYQHGIIGLPEFYFPSKSDFFYAYSLNKELQEYFINHNKYKTKLHAVGNLKYRKVYREIDNKIKNNSALIILTPSWAHFQRTLKVVTKSKADFHFIFRFHPAMKFKLLAKGLLWAKGFNLDANQNVSFRNIDVVITEVSTVGFEALAEGVPIAILTELNYSLPHYFASEALPKIQIVNRQAIDNALSLYNSNESDIRMILKDYFG